MAQPIKKQLAKRIALVALVTFALATFPARADEADFQKRFSFWINVYTRYSVYQAVVHDAKYIDHIYEIADNRKPSHVIRAHYRKLLLSIHHKEGHPETLTKEERRIYDLFSDIHEPCKFLNAAHRKRLRVQVGQRDSFLEALQSSGKYLPWMEKVFEAALVPKELSRLPFVESSFNLKAESKVGATGIWQFMRSTGELFLEINDAIDERNDPIRESEAAAQLLKINFDSLHSWSLAVTAYNHGRIGMMRAVRKMGSVDLNELTSFYRARPFGFSSSNFYAQLLAVIEIEKNADLYFKKITRSPPVEFQEVQIPDYLSIQALARFTHVTFAQMKALNPSFTQKLLAGRQWVPSGYPIRLPRTTSLAEFWRGYGKIPARLKHGRQRTPHYARR